MNCRNLVAMAMAGIGVVAVYAQNGTCDLDNCHEDSHQSFGLSLLQQRAIITSTERRRRRDPYELCTCDTPNGYCSHNYATRIYGCSGTNGYTCTDGYSAWCGTHEECYAKGKFKKGNWGDGCAVTCTCDCPNTGTV